MKYFYIKKNLIYDFEFHLNSNYNLGFSYSDCAAGKFVRLSQEQISFYHEHPSATCAEIWNMKLNEPTPDINQLKINLANKAEQYYNSDAINLVPIQGVNMYLDPLTRFKLAARFAAEKKYKEISNLTYNGKTYSLPITILEDILDSLEIYYGECWDVKECHLSAISNIESFSDSDYDYTLNYPQKPSL